MPSLSMHLYFGSGPDLLLRVRTMEIDCAITSSRFTDPKLDAFRLHREDYAFVGAAALLKACPLKRDADAEGHALLDVSADLPLFRYFRDAPGGGDRLAFPRIVRLGSIEAIRDARAPRRGRRGLAALPGATGPRRAGRSAASSRSSSCSHDWFRLVFRADDARRSVYERLAGDDAGVAASLTRR